jgi:hypothetical protein
MNAGQLSLQHIHFICVSERLAITFICYRTKDFIVFFYFPLYTVTCKQVRHHVVTEVGGGGENMYLALFFKSCVA